MEHINRYALTIASAALVCGTAAAQDRTTQNPAPRASTSPQQQQAQTTSRVFRLRCDRIDKQKIER